MDEGGGSYIFAYGHKYNLQVCVCLEEHSGIGLGDPILASVWFRVSGMNPSPEGNISYKCGRIDPTQIN